MSGNLDEVKNYLDYGLESSTADEIEIIAIKQSLGLTRFSNSSIHQNMEEKNVIISIRTIFGNRIGVASFNFTNFNSIIQAVKEAEENARLSPEDKDYPGLPKSSPLTDSRHFKSATAKASAVNRAGIVGRIVEKVEGEQLSAAGSVSTSSAIVGVANSHGSQSIGKISEAVITLVVTGENSSGYSQFYSDDLSSFQPGKLAEMAVSKAIASQHPVEIKPGRYQVILEPPAVADMISFLAYVGLGAKSYQEKRSFLCNKLGKKLISDKISIWDDARHPATIGLSFDFEGVPKQKVVFFDEGVAKSVVYDSYTAARESKNSTGHALPPSSNLGPLPTNLIMRSGDTSLEEMVSQIERGLLVTRFHYTNIEDPMATIYTGMTRDGTFLVEDGQIKAGVKNLRFTQNILEALSNVVAVSNQPQLVESMLGACYVPHLLINDFNMTGGTKF